MRCLIVGGHGQLGRALRMTAPVGSEVVAPGRAECDIRDAEDIEHWLETVRPALVFNAAAYTAVDEAEMDPAQAELVNAKGPGLLANAVRRLQARLVHVSTDFIFDGASSSPYTPEDKPNPLNNYGRTKLDGERNVEAACPGSLIVRTSWLYAEYGRNFVHTMLRLMRERRRIEVVADQIGSPTYADNLARSLWTLAGRSASGLYHFADEGVASWYDFAVAVADEALDAGLLVEAPHIVPIAARDYPTVAVRPRFSVLDKARTRAFLGGDGQHWRHALHSMFERMKRNG